MHREIERGTDVMYSELCEYNDAEGNYLIIYNTIIMYFFLQSPDQCCCDWCLPFLPDVQILTRPGRVLLFFRARTDNL